MSENKNRRSVYLINPRFQYSFIIFSSIVSFLSLSVFFLAIQFFFWRLISRGKALGIPDGHIFFRFIQDQQFNMTIVFAISAVVVLFISIIGALMLSHKVAGPIYRLVQDLKKMNSGSPMKKIKFRDGDFFMEVQDEFNQFIEKHEGSK